MPGHQHQPPRGFGRGPRVADRMTPDYLSFVASSLAAERSGDAVTALEYHRGVPMFRRSAHLFQLTQLVGVAGQMTPWLWARWAAYQCTRAEDPGTDSGAIHRCALDYVLRMFHDAAMQELYDAHEDPVGLVSSTVGEDWAFHQICTFELGGLEAFVADLAAGRLADEMGLARDWVGTRVSGYRLERPGPLRLSATDLGSGESTDLLDLGAGVGAGSGACVLGRLVPSGTQPGWMFDTRPLTVDERTARAAAVAAHERGGWITALSDAVVAGRFRSEELRREDRELVTDVPGLDLVEVGTSSSALASTMASLRDGRDEVGRAAFRILRSAAEGTFGADERAPYVGAAALNPHGHAEARRLLAPSGAEWGRWAELVPEPARSRLRALGVAGASAA